MSRKGLEIAYRITDYLFERFISIPLITMFHEVAVTRNRRGMNMARPRGWQDHRFRSDKGCA